MRRVLMLAAFAAGCSAETPAPEGPAVRISGSETMAQRLVPTLAAAYQRVRPDVALVGEGGGSAVGFRKLLDGQTDLAAATRAASPAEVEQARANGYDLRAQRHIIGVDVVAIGVHPRNQVESLTYDQVIGIFCTGEIDDWSFLGQDSRPIRVLARDPQSGTRALFEDFFCGPKGMHRKVEVLDVPQIDEALRNDVNAISFLSLSELPPKVLGLRSESLGHPVLPSQQNVIRGAYPLYHDLYLYTAGSPSAETAAFLDWLSTPAGQDVVDEARFVPLYLRPERMDEPRPLRETIHFEAGSSAPDQRSLARIQLLVHELRDRAGEYQHIVLEGYTDDREENGAELARQRAEAVQTLLSAELPGMFFEVIPRADANPIAPNGTPFGRMQNRRVAIYLAEEEREGPPKAPPPEE